MKQLALLAVVLSFGGFPEGPARASDPPRVSRTAGPAWPSDLPVYDHVVIVVEENKDYDEIIGSPLAGYINTFLRTEGASFTQMFGEEHHSQGNYFWLFAGTNCGVGFDDVVPSYPLTASNLGASLIARGLSLKGYAEDLPSVGSIKNLEGHYARKHVPWISFANVPNGSTVDTSSNLRFADFPKDYTKLPTVAIVVPNLVNDMHDGDPSASIPAGDIWLRNNLDSYYQWAKKNNSLLIVTFDESNDRSQIIGLTDPAVLPKNQLGRDIQNRIPTIFAGARVKTGEYSEDKGINHVTILRTLEAMYGLPRSGAQQPKACCAGISDDKVITDVFVRNKAK